MHSNLRRWICSIQKAMKLLLILNKIVELKLACLYCPSWFSSRYWQTLSQLHWLISVLLFSIRSLSASERFFTEADDSNERSQLLLYCIFSCFGMTSWWLVVAESNEPSFLQLIKYLTILKRNNNCFQVLSIFLCF